jgi:hypothetical protein
MLHETRQNVFIQVHTMPRINIVSQVNSKKITRSGNRITLRDVVPIVDDIVMNGILYPAQEVKAATASLNSVPMPMGHPQDANGNYISASSGEALLNDYAGAIATNARHSDGRSLIDVVINIDQANAHKDGIELVKRAEAAMSGETIAPIHISTGVMLTKTQMEGNSKGKAYKSVASNMSYDHVAILLHQEGAGTPSEGVGMYLNAAGESEPVDTAYLVANETQPRGILKWIASLFGNSSDVSFDQITSALQQAIGGYDGNKWVQEVYDKYFIYRDGEKLYRQDYVIDSENVVQLLGSVIEVKREVEYKTINTKKVDHMKESIIAALNAAGIATEGKDEAALLSAYNALVTKPVSDKLTAANSKIAEFEQVANAAKDAELTALATPLAVNSALTVDELKALGADRLKELSAKAAPLVANTGAPQHKNTAFDAL